MRAGNMRLAWTFLGIAVALSGCAFQKQAIEIKPALEATAGDVGRGHKVWVTISDERPHTTLGTRGAQGVGAELTVAGDLSASIKNSVAEGLRQKGFTVLDGPAPDGRELHIEVRNLDYQVVVGFWAGTLHTSCGLKGVCMAGSSRSFENMYRGENQVSIQVVQSDERNIRFVNLVVSQAINALLGDTTLTGCLASPPGEPVAVSSPVH